MAIICLAGGTGSLGKTFLEALSSSPSQRRIYILTRSTPSQPNTTHLTYHQTSYTSLPTLTAFLTTHAITTVISTITIESPQTSAAQQTLILAASQSPSVTHFIPSEYSFPVSPALLSLAPMWQHCADNAAVLAATGSLSYTRVRTGWFMDYFGMPHVASHLSPFPWAVDARRMVAAVPGTGGERVSMTYTADLTRFVAWLVEHPDTEEWAGKEVLLVGDDVTFNEVVAWVEGARGRSFETVVYDDGDRLRKGQVTRFQGQEETTYGEWFAMFGLTACEGLMGLPQEGRV
ncbi:uncharacterized protein HMPREF1541_07912 [Cyphellophora europaea CBS 101466]|uniref:NmrA-like domain-containing protein n=1 Tax=Cyphellophora europaea (strain CBS 101466) TaxID=1220924 RepID=W2RKU2_CYPE1|nr:uncharacterized protein HMPREF1541_07912 [Cyphellophora europaea CBS 101466]ETN36925.1 hypothetical protein HMPREF1541_07912 [Cyphellophora europaea CBS 101466]